MVAKSVVNNENIITEPRLVYQTLISLSKLLDKISLNYYITGGLAYRILSASQQKKKLKIKNLRQHKDIDIIVFDEDFVAFLESLKKSNMYKIWFPAEIGLRRRLPGEHHFVSLKDRKTGVIIALFRAVKFKKGRLIRTILFDNFHPQQVFKYPPVRLNGNKLKIVAPEWLYYNSVLREKNKDDGQLVFPWVSFEKFNQIQFEAKKSRADRLVYKKEIEVFGSLLRNKKII